MSKGGKKRERESKELTLSQFLKIYQRDKDIEKLK